MDDTDLLLLGLLKMQAGHGYQINEFIERNLGRMAHVKRATAYAILERLHQEGYAAVRMEQEGNRPPRKVFSITPAGEAHFLDLLRQSLTRAKSTTGQSSIAFRFGLAFITDLPREEMRSVVGAWIAATEEEIAEFEAIPHHPMPGVHLMLEHHLVLLWAERDWLAGLLASLAD